MDHVRKDALHRKVTQVTDTLGFLLIFFKSDRSPTDSPQDSAAATMRRPYRALDEKRSVRKLVLGLAIATLAIQRGSAACAAEDPEPGYALGR